MAKQPFKGFGLSLKPSEDKLGSSFQRLGAFKSGSVAEAIVSKLVESMIPTGFKDGQGKQSIAPPNMLVNQVANKTAANVTDADNMLQLLPDMELAKQVLVSAVLAPNDMMSAELTYGSNAPDLGEVKGKLVEIVSKYFQETYKIKPLLSKILDDVLFSKGSYPMAILPESTIDYAINDSNRVTMEDIKGEFDDDGNPQHYGLLGNSTYDRMERVDRSDKKAFDVLKFSTESLKSTVDSYTPEIEGVYVSVTDNINVLKFPILKDKMVQDRIQDVYASRGIAMEARRARMTRFNQEGMNGGEISMRQAQASLYRQRQFSYTPIIHLKTLNQLEKPTVGHPLVMSLPSESVIPVHSPSNPEDHVGYFIVLDKHGNPVRAHATHDWFADLSYNANNAREMTSQLLAQTRRASEGRKQSDEFMLDEAVQLYTEIVENDLISRLKNGLMGENVKIARPQEVYRIMFARAAARMMTQLVFIPTSLMAYFAFDYNEYGVGKGLLEATKIIGGIRSMLLFSNTIAAIKNSVGHVEVGITLDPNDPDPDRTVEYIMHEYAKTRQAAYPIGASNPLDVINYLQNAGVQITTTGHPGYPETKVQIDDKQTNHTKVDTELDENMKKRHLMAIGVAPETVDLSMNVDFATSVVSSNVLLAKRAMVIQEKFTKHLGEFMQKYVVNSQILMDLLRGVVESHREKFPLGGDSKLDTDAIVLYFVNSLTISLPEPDLSRIEVQAAAFDKYSELLDKVLPAFISSEMFDASIMGELSETVTTTVNILKAMFQRQWLIDNNVMPELFQIIDINSKDGPAFDLMQQHSAYMSGISKTLIKFMKDALTNLAKNDKLLNDIKEATGAEPGEPSSPASVPESGGSDEFGLGLDEAPTEEETPPEDEEGGEPNPEGEEKPEGEEPKPEEEK